jgi:hypothetical protein
MSKLINHGNYGCIYYPGIDCNGNIVKENVVSKLIETTSANHEISISNQIRKIKHYQDHFLPVLDSCTVKQFPKEECKLKKQNAKYKILYVLYKDKLPYSYTFRELYHSLLQSVDLLIQHKIVHFDINSNNIICSDKVYLIDFGLSISMKHVYSQLKERFYMYAIHYYIWPLEVHFICYLLHKGPITTKSLTQICTDFVKHHIILQHSSSEFVKEYLTNSIDYFSKLIDLSLTESIRTCIQSWKTWDNYALILYLFEEGYTIPNTFLKNIHYLPTERISVAHCLTATSSP